MALETNCTTPGAIFTTHITPTRIEIYVDLPKTVDLTEDQSEHLQDTIHNALELALTPLFVTHPSLKSTEPYPK